MIFQVQTLQFFMRLKRRFALFCFQELVEKTHNLGPPNHSDFTHIFGLHIIDHFLT